MGRGRPPICRRTAMTRVATSTQAMTRFPARVAKRPDPVLLGVATAVLAYDVACGSRLAGPGMRSLTGWLLFVSFHLGTAVFAYRIARGADAARSVRRFWAAVGVAAASFLVGDVLQLTAVIPDPTGHETGTPAQALCVNIGIAVLLVVMLTAPLGLQTAAERTRFWLDTATVMAATAGFGVYFTLEPDAVPLSPAHLLRWVLDVVFGPVVFLVGVFVVVKLVSGGAPPFTRRCAVILAAAAAMQGVAAGLQPVGPSNWIGVLNVTANGLLAAGARVQQLQVRGDPAVLGRHHRRPYSRLPYLAIGATYALLVTVLARDGLDGRAWGVLSAAIVSTGLVVVRQLAAFAENAHLLSQLDRKVHELNQTEEVLRASLRERDDLAAELRHQAFHDSLTGLPNRALFVDRGRDRARPGRAHRRRGRHPADRPGRLQAGQRPPRPRQRRRAAQTGRAAPAPVLTRDRYGSAYRRGRVRGGARGAGRRGLHRGGGTRAAGAADTIRGGRGAGRRARQRGRGGRPERRARERRPAAGGRRGDVCRQASRQGWFPGVHPGQPARSSTAGSRLTELPRLPMPICLRREVGRAAAMDAPASRRAPRSVRQQASGCRPSRRCAPPFCQCASSALSTVTIISATFSRNATSGIVSTGGRAPSFITNRARNHSRSFASREPGRTGNIRRLINMASRSRRRSLVQCHRPRGAYGKRNCVQLFQLGASGHARRPGGADRARAGGARPDGRGPIQRRHHRRARRLGRSGRETRGEHLRQGGVAALGGRQPAGTRRSALPRVLTALIWEASAARDHVADAGRDVVRSVLAEDAGLSGPSGEQQSAGARGVPPSGGPYRDVGQAGTAQDQLDRVRVVPVLGTHQGEAPDHLVSTRLVGRLYVRGERAAVAEEGLVGGVRAPEFLVETAQLLQLLRGR